MMKRVVAGTLLVMAAAAPVCAKGWEPIVPTVRVGLTNYENLISGLSPVYTDQGAEPQVELETSRRLSKSIKMGVAATAATRFMRRLPDANYSVLGLGTSFRGGPRTITLEGDWTPKRNVSPLAAADEGGQYKSYAGTLGYRQTVNKLRLRAEATWASKDYVTLLDIRDAHALEGYFNASIAPQKGVDLRSEASTEWENANGDRYDKRTAMAGVGLGVTSGVYKTDFRLRSVKKRYPNAILGDSNFRRRDQRLELQLKLSRPWRPGLTVWISGDFANQTSSRPAEPADVNNDGFDDHTRGYNYSINSFQLGLEWIGGSK